MDDAEKIIRRRATTEMYMEFVAEYAERHAKGELTDAECVAFVGVAVSNWRRRMDELK